MCFFNLSIYLRIKYVVALTLSIKIRIQRMAVFSNPVQLPTLTKCSRLAQPRSPGPICSRDHRKRGSRHGPDRSPHPLPCVRPVHRRHPQERAQWRGDARLLRQQDGLLREPLSWTVPVWNHSEWPDSQKCSLHCESWWWVPMSLVFHGCEKTTDSLWILLCMYCNNVYCL